MSKYIIFSLYEGTMIEAYMKAYMKPMKAL